MPSDLSRDLIRFDVAREGLSIGVIRLSDLQVGKSRPEFEEYEKTIFSEIRSRWTLEDLATDAIFRSYRDLYWTFGMDPTKLRVSSEALVRRILNGNNLWRINDVVDVINLASAYHAIPIGLIDEDTIDGTLVVRTAKRGEIFRRIGGKELVCRGREIVLADQSKIVCFGYATHDSDYTKVSPQSKRVLVLLYGSPEVSASKMNSALDATASMISQWLTCELGQPKRYVPFR
ncbi:MAG: B3/B4 domain-containing protein [Candidatus Thorarchaeota archaeon]